RKAMASVYDPSLSSPSPTPGANVDVTSPASIATYATLGSLHLNSSPPGMGNTFNVNQFLPEQVVNGALQYMDEGHFENQWIQNSNSETAQALKAGVVFLDKGLQTTAEMLPVMLATEGMGVVAANADGAFSAAAEMAANGALKINKFVGIGMQWHFVN